MSRAARSGWMLLECMLALALLVVLAVAVQGALGMAATSVRYAERSAQCEDLARSVLGAIELGLASPGSVHDRVVDWPGEAPWADPGDRLGAFDESASPGAFAIEVETEPSAAGLMLVRVTVRTNDGSSGRATLEQLMPPGGEL